MPIIRLSKPTLVILPEQALISNHWKSRAPAANLTLLCVYRTSAQQLASNLPEVLGLRAVELLPLGPQHHVKEVRLCKALKPKY